MSRILSILLLTAVVLTSACKKEDDEGNTQTSDPDNESPEVYLSFENVSGQFIESDTLVMNAQASDSDGVITSVKFFLGETLIGTDNDVPFRCTWISSEQGEYIFTAVAYDDDGSWAQSNTRTLVVLSGTIPHISIQEPNNGTFLKEGSSVAVRTTAWDYDGTVQKIEVYFNDDLLNTHYNETTTLDSIHNIQLGEFKLKALAYDDDGHVSEPDEKVIEVTPNNPPTAEIGTYYPLEDLWAGETIRLDVEVNDWDGQVMKIELYASGMLVAADSTSTYFHDIYWDDIEAGTFDLQLRAYDDAGGIGVSNTLTVDVNQRLSTNGRIVCFEWGDSPDIAYALVSETNELLILNPAEKALVKSISLPHSHPLRMKYSEQDDKLYIVSYYTGAVSVFNVQTENFTEFTFSSAADGRDIDIVPQRRRIYVAASNGVYILNMDGGTVLAENLTYECVSIACMHAQQKVIANFDYYSGELQRYSVEGDSFVTEEQFDEGSPDCYKMLIPSDDSKLIYPCIGYGSQISALDPLNFQNTLGVYQSGSNRDLCLSKDGSFFFMVGWDGIAIFNANTYVKVTEDKFGIPNIDDYETTVGINNDGSTLMVFTCDDYYEDEYFIYFLEKSW